jgi:UDP-N-acetylglucosamine:LPS N-acetylglucosamine transferase
VVVGPDYEGVGGTTAAIAASVVREPIDLAGRLARADVAVLGAGTMKFEAAALGIPTILVGVADDQLETGQAFAATGAARWAGDGRTVDPHSVATTLLELLADPAKRAEMARRGPIVVPGDGGTRILATLLKVAGTQAVGVDRK